MDADNTIKRALGIGCVALALTACGGGGGRDSGACEAELLAGDIVISELYLNAPSDDKGNEWIEIYNARSEAVDLGGAVVQRSRLDDSAQKQHEFGDVSIEAGEYLVVGDQINEPGVLSPWVDYGYGADLGEIANGSGRIIVGCGDNIIDEVTYDNVVEAASRGFDGSSTPQAEDNDDLMRWCDARTEFTPGELGTPGVPNDACGSAGPTSCREDGDIRIVERPQVGDLIITEFMANPEAVGDGEGEWIEVYVARDVDINGVELGKVMGEPEDFIGAGECLRATAGTYLLFAAEEDPAINGGLPELDGTISFSLSNSGDQLLFVGWGGEVLDSVTYTSSSTGAATSLDPRFRDVAQNDNDGFFCPAVDSYGAGDRGTPGAANPECESIMPPPGTCLADGEFIDLTPPEPGDLVITEFMANPEASEEADGEWFEIRALQAVTLNGLEMGTIDDPSRSTVDVADCLTLDVDDHAVIARERDTAINGGLPQVDATFSFALTNSDGSLSVGIDGTVLDQVAWTSTSAGASTSLDPAFATPGDNDDEANWCPGTAAYGAGDLGSPGAINGSCGAPDECLDGGMPRMVVSPTVGDLVITEFMANPAAVGDTEGEWFEVLVTANAAVDLNGLELGRDVGDVEDVLPGAGDCLTVNPGDRIVFVKDLAPGVNGGIMDAFGTFGFSLNNSNRGIFVGIGGEVIDVITYTSVGNGVASNLSSGSEDEVANDDQGNFCPAVAPYGDGDLGTPGGANIACAGGNQCLDGGTPRDIMSPAAEELVITEYMANPAMVADSAGEWFEVLVATGGGDVDLNGLELTHTDTLGVFQVEQTLDAPNCLTVSDGQLVLFARNADAMLNGGMNNVDYTFNFNLVQTSDRGIGLQVAGTVIDEVTWSSVNIDAGQSRTLDPPALDAVTNDNEANWCDGSSAYGDGDLGTPGIANDDCIP